MTSEARIAANRLNAQKSTGPRTALGKARSSRNARRHGLRSARERIFRENSLAFEEKLRRFSAATQPQTDVEEYLLYQNTSMAASFERLQRAHADRIQTRSEGAQARDADAASELGSQLFFDPCGPIALYGSQPANYRKNRTSWSADRKALQEPERLVKALMATAAGCRWMRERWQELRAFLKRPRGFWSVIRPPQMHPPDRTTSDPRTRRRTSRGDLRGRPRASSHGHAVRTPPERHGHRRAQEVREGRQRAMERTGGLW